MEAPKVTQLNETHRGGEHLVSCTFEVDITQVPLLLHSFDVSDVNDSQLDHLIETADAVAKARKVEAEALAKRDAAEAEIAPAVAPEHE